MRNLIIAAAILGFLASSTSAMAAQQLEGKVQSIDAAAGTLTLQSGESFSFANPTALRGILPGSLVGVTYRDQGQGIRTFDPHAAMDETAQSF